MCKTPFLPLGMRIGEADPTKTEAKPNKTCLGMFVLLLYCLIYTHQGHFDAPTPVSRLDLLHALFAHGTVCINAYHNNTPDKAVMNGKYYSDKAPGTAALAMAPFALAAAALSVAGTSLDSGSGWLFSSWVACAGSIGIITAVGGVALFAWLSRRVPPRSALLTTLALWLGAAPLPYATMMFSHALVVGLLAIAVWAIDRQRETTLGGEGSRTGSWLRANRWDALAGLACGWALASEYSSGLVIAGLFLWLLPSRGRRIVPFCAAAVLPLLLIPAYNWACFGNPFTLPYSHQASFPEMREGLYAIKWPDAETAFNLLFSPARGLLFWTPFFAMAGFGYWELIRRSRRLFWLTYAVPLLQVAVISGRVWDWPAGPAWGPRLLSPMLPLLALPCAFGVARFPRLGWLLALGSITVTTLATLTDACPPFNGHPNPLLDFNLPLLAKGRLSPNLGLLLDLPPFLSLALFYAILIVGVWWLWRRLGKTQEPAVALTGAKTAAPATGVLNDVPTDWDSA